jgi:hypothetical protein
VIERLQVLRGTGTGVPESSGGEAVAAGDGYVKVNVNAGGGRNGRGSGTEIQIPVGASAGSDMEPVTVETVRVKPGKGHNATRHFQVVRQGDKVLAVIKGEQNDNTLTPRVSDDFGEVESLD